MIKSVAVSNYILIDELSVDFDKSLNVITGETGAGKSILIGAIDAVFGGKCSKEVIKTGSSKAVIEITLFTANEKALDMLKKNEIELDNGEITLSREITPTVSKFRINGVLANQNIVKELRSYVLDIHSQHQSYTYIQPKYHIKLLDSYLKSTYGDLLNQYSLMYTHYTDLKLRYKNLKSQSELTESQIDFLKFQIDEIESAALNSPKEDEELQKEANVLANAEKLKELTGKTYWSLSEDDNSILNALSILKSDLSKAVQLDNNLAPHEETLIDACELLHDLASNLRQYSQDVENNTGRLNEIQERLFSLDKLKRKYGKTLDEVLNTLDRLRGEYFKTENSNIELENLREEITKTESDLTKFAKEISEKRKQYAQTLSSLIEKTLVKLELPKCRFNIELREIPLCENGIDDVEFMISTNISEPLKPLEKTASGGEISRVMLAIKSIFAQNDDIDTIIFDETDTGISGKTSQVVAEEISNLAKYRQVIMITHQAIIAAKADKHLYVKKSQDKITNVQIYTLSQKDRLRAIAELAGGNVTEVSLDFAKTLIK